MEVNNGDYISLIGPNGSGKSTLIKLLSNDLKPSLGSIYFKSQNISNWNVMEIAKYRAILPQSNMLNFAFTVLDIIKMGRYPFKGTCTNFQNEMVCMKLIEIFDLENHIHQNYMTLSGGEKQRVQLARVFSQIWDEEKDYEHKILILDEPTSALDIKHQIMLIELLKNINKNGLTIIIVLHDLNQAIMNANKLLVLNEGKIAAFGGVENIVESKMLDKVFGINIDILESNEVQNKLLIYNN
tara:strand:+ start:1036 stop:1758 length:723 start_codon:yes stop_codon:yes gene_type:complete